VIAFAILHPEISALFAQQKSPNTINRQPSVALLGAQAARITDHRVCPAVDSDPKMAS
jgi:hypothetical protein